jgi:cytochrome c oxidase subunit 3
MDVSAGGMPFPPGPLPAPAGPIPGNRGIWVGIFAVLTEFALMFLVYFIARAHHPEAFHEGPQRLSTLAGTLNTVLMLSSGYCVVRAVHAMAGGARAVTLRWLLPALVLGCGYPVVKVLEIRWNLAHGIDGEAGIFFTVYYYLTLNHLVHVSWGLLGLGWVMARTALGIYSREDYGGLEAFACYWHTTDLVWLVIFPLFYVLR